MPLSPEITALIKQNMRQQVNQLQGVAVGAGSVLGQTALSEDGMSNTRQATLGGALQGFGAGASLGPLGAIGGALLGGVSGFGAANQSNADFYDGQALNQAFNLSSKTVNPTAFGKGGFIDDDLAVQMELGESYMTPELEIFDSKATKTHKKMGKDEITDVVKPESFVFSNQKDYDPDKHKDTLLGYGVAHYSEDGNHSLDKVTMADVFGDSKKKMTFSEGVRKLRSHYKTVGVGEDDTDLLTQITNQENLQARMPFANELIKAHRGDKTKQEKFEPQQYAMGDVVRRRPNFNIGQDVPVGYMRDELGRVVPDPNYVPQPITQGLAQPTALPTGSRIDSLFSDFGDDLDMMEQQNAQDFANTNQQTGALFNRMGARSGLASLAQGIATGMQSTQVNPNLVDTRFSDQMFEEMSPAMVDQMADQNMARANSTIANVSRTSPQVANQLAPRLFEASLRQGNNQRAQINNSNMAQRRAKYSFLNSAGNANSAARNQADEATRNLINKKRQNLAGVATGFLGNADRLDVNEYGMNRAAEGQFNNNNMSIMQNQMNSNAMQARMDAMSQSFKDRYSAMSMQGRGGATPQPSAPTPMSLLPIQGAQVLQGQQVAPVNIQNGGVGLNTSNYNGGAFNPLGQPNYNNAAQGYNPVGQGPLENDLYNRLYRRGGIFQ